MIQTLIEGHSIKYLISALQKCQTRKRLRTVTDQRTLRRREHEMQCWVLPRILEQKKRTMKFKTKSVV